MQRALNATNECSSGAKVISHCLLRWTSVKVLECWTMVADLVSSVKVWVKSSLLLDTSTALTSTLVLLTDASSRAAAADNVSFHLLDGERIPLEDSSVDRVLCKNVLEYVPNVRETIHEFRRVLEPGGRVLLIDSDWRFVAVEPWGAQRTRQFFDAAAIAFKEPEIGRKLRALLLESGFAEVDVTVQAGVDTEGGSLSVLRNMASYAREGDSGVDIDVDSMIEEAEAAIANDRYLFCLPQFRVTGIKPSL